MTTNRSCFTRIIGHNSRTIHRICTKFDARIRLWTPLLCAKLQGDQSTRLRFIAIFASVQKDEEKKRRKNETMEARISETAVAISFQFGMYTLLAGGKLCSKFGYNRIKDHRDTKV